VHVRYIGNEWVLLRFQYNVTVDHVFNTVLAFGSVCVAAAIAVPHCGINMPWVRHRARMAFCGNSLQLELLS
jgi:hypothetical protein